MHKDICAICLNNNGTFIKTVCNHEFHEDCLNEWIKYKENCPICRQNLENFDFKNAFISIVYDIPPLRISRSDISKFGFPSTASSSISTLLF